MTVRTAYPNVIAEAAEGLGIGEFQRVVEVELHGASCNDASLAEVAELSKLVKLLVGPTNPCESALARFRRLRPDVRIVQTDYGRDLITGGPTAGRSGRAATRIRSFDVESEIWTVARGGF